MHLPQPVNHAVLFWESKSKLSSSVSGKHAGII